MPRLSRALRLAALLALAVAVLGLPARAEDEEEAAPKFSFRTDLESKAQRALAGAASAYLDPAVEFLWRPRKEFIAALTELQADKGVNALVDIPLLREIVYQGRHFLTRFSDKKWQREEEITDFKKTDGLYLNLVSEGYRFTYTLPKGYPKERDLARVPRPEPYPLLLCIPEVIDGKDARMQPQKYPGGAVLKRRYPKGDFADLYNSWLTLAPVAARAKFLEEGAIRHRFLTGVLTTFWRSYHIDFDRIVVDGTGPAAAMAAAFPHVFAGVVLRPGKAMKFEPEVVRNYATVPVFVVDDKDLGKQIEEAGHPNVTVGSSKELVAWMGERRRRTPTAFKWSVLRPDHTYANWVTITGPDYAASERTLEVEVLDTEADPNTIALKATGIESVMLFLNDEIVDMSRPIRLVLNGEEKTYEQVARDFGRLFEDEPKVRENMNFGWLYTALLEDIDIPEPKVEEPPPESSTEPTPEGGTQGSPEDETRAAKLWGRAETFEAEGDKVKALVYYKKIVEIGETSFRARAQAKVEELK